MMTRAFPLTGQAPVTATQRTPQSRGNRGKTGDSAGLQASSTFQAAFQKAQEKTATKRQPDVQSSSPGVGQVVISPFNPLGLPISGTPAPTAAEVAENPEKWRGTSFDPALGVRPNIWVMRELEGEVAPGARSW